MMETLFTWLIFMAGFLGALLIGGLIADWLESGRDDW